jgi:hypothetical protein
MGKIIRFKTPQDNMIETLEFILGEAKNGNIQSFAFAAKLTDGTIGTSYFNADVGTKQELLGHIQVDIMYQVMEANMDKLVEWV